MNPRPLRYDPNELGSLASPVSPANTTHGFTRTRFVVFTVCRAIVVIPFCLAVAEELDDLSEFLGDERD